MAKTDELPVTTKEGLAHAIEPSVINEAAAALKEQQVAWAGGHHDRLGCGPHQFVINGKCVDRGGQAK